MNRYPHILIAILLIFSMVQISPSQQGINPTKDDIDLNLRDQNQTEIPVWSIGDTWIYETDIISDTEDGLFILNSNDLTIKVVGMDTVVHEGLYQEVYRIDLSANITGTIQSSFITGDVEGEIVGNASMRKADLSLITSNISIIGIIEYLIIFESDFYMKSYAEYYPSFEYFDFPLKTNEEWNISTTAYQNSSFYVEDFVPENTTEGTGSMSGYAECFNEETITVPAGSFDCFHLISENNGSIESWYAPLVKNVARMYINNTNQTDTSKVWMNLSDYTLHDQQLTINASFTKPVVNVSEPVTISGFVTKTSDNTSIGGVNVSIHIPCKNKTYYVRSNTQGFFTKTFIAPLIIDPTNTSYDIGSDGIIISCDTGSLSGFMVKTLTVIGIAIDEWQAIPPVQYETLSVNLTCRIYSVENVVNKTVSITGPTGFTPINISLTDAGSDRYYYTQPYTIIGNYSFYFWAKDALGNTNQTPISNFSIIPDTLPPTIDNVTDEPDPQWETYPVLISCNVTDNVAVDQVHVLITDPIGTINNISMNNTDHYYFHQQSFNLIGNYSYMIWARDTLGNSETSLIQTFTILEDATPPVINDIQATPNPQLEGGNVNISCNVTDNVEIDQVTVIITDPSNTTVNITMNVLGDIYFYETEYTLLGEYQYRIWTIDTLGNMNLSTINTFVIDPIVPEFSEINIDPLVQFIDGYVNISCVVTDNVAVDTVKINMTGPVGFNPINETMNLSSSGSYYWYQNYSVNGTYELFLWANDSQGFTNTTSIVTFQITNQSYQMINISVYDGWNLITIPVETGWYASDLIANVTDCLMVSWFDAENQTFRTATSSGGYDFPLLAGWGYFVYQLSNTSIVVNGSVVVNVSVPLEVGWNMIGWYHDNDTMASSLMDNISGCIMVSWYDNENETYRTATSSGGYDFVVFQSMGLFVYTTEASVWYGEG